MTELETELSLLAARAWVSENVASGTDPQELGRQVARIAMGVVEVLEPLRPPEISYSYADGETNPGNSPEAGTDALPPLSVLQGDSELAAGADMTDCPRAVVLHALDLCERDFAFIAGCTVTDQPDLPPSKQARWKMDFSRQLAAIAAARAAMAERGAGRIGHECAGCSTGLPSGLTSSHSKCVWGHEGSRSPGGCL